MKFPDRCEISLIAKLLAKQKRYSAIIVYGIIVKGETDHYEVIRDACINELGKINTEFEVPIIMEILPVRKLEDAIARTEGKNNKDIEAALAAISMVQLCHDLKS